MDENRNKQPARCRARWRADRYGFAACCLGAALSVACQAEETTNLPGVTVYSSRVANQTSTGAFAQPVSALRYEPLVDIHARNLAEGQADITIRGGIFENTGIQLGAVSLGDPQTGHYLAEVPVAPALLGAPRVVTGADLALGAANATVGVVAYSWRSIRTAGAAALGWGEDNMRRVEVYQGFSGIPMGTNRGLGIDVALAHAKSDGAVPFGDYDFSRTNLRLQYAGATSQTDLFAGYQAKQFGWPNLYTPFNSNETENLQTALFVLNHRADLGRGEYLEAGIFHRRNKDDYAFNRFAAVGAVHPFQHTTWLGGGAVTTRRLWGELAVEARAEILADRLESTSLTAGKYRSRSMNKVSLLVEKDWKAAEDGGVRLRAGGTRDDTNRDGGTLSPVVDLSREFHSGPLKKLHAGYARTSQVSTYTALNASSTAGLFRGNPNLGRSISQNLEFGVAGGVWNWTTEATMFHRRDQALVDWTFRRGVTARTANPVDVDVTGLELMARRSWSACDVVLGYTGLGKVADYRGAAVDASFYALNYARQRLTAALSLRLGHGIELRIDNAARVQAGNLLRVVGGDWALSTAVGLSYRPAWRRGLELSLRVDNVWDDPFQEVPAVPASPRQFSLAAAYLW